MNSNTNKNYYMKNIVLFGAAAALLLASCSQPKDKKTQLDALRKQQDELTVQIDSLEKQIARESGDSAVKVNLVETKAIVPATFLTYIDVLGKVDADENVGLSSEIPGTVTKINVKVGDEVSKGQVLAETDARTIQQNRWR